MNNQNKAIETLKISLNDGTLWLYDLNVSSITLHTLTRFNRSLHIKAEMLSEPQIQF